jgi:fermentation-respiration switch protein FrsA (DUF1100 family)
MQAIPLEIGARVTVVQPVSRGRLWRSVAALALFWATLWCAAVLSLGLGQSLLLFNAGESRMFTAEFDRSVFADASFVTQDGLRLESVLLTHGPSDDRYWILFCPPAGASTRVARIQEHLRQLWSLGYNVFAFDYRGFGGNAGTPSEAGLYEDARAAYRFLTNTHGVTSSRIVLAGRSLGASVALDLATKVDSGGVLLFSPIDSVPNVAARLYPWAPVRWLARYQFDNRTKAPTIHRPVVLVYGAPDYFMSLLDVRSLFREFRDRKRFLKTSGDHHDSGFVDVKALNAALVEFWPPSPSKTCPSSPRASCDR